MSARVKWDGLDDLRAELRRLPDELTGEASHIVQASGNAAAVTVRSIYGEHRVTGHLQNSVVVEQRAAGRYGAAVVVKATDPIAWLFDHGSQARHWLSGKSTGTMWGRTPPTHAFVGTMIRERRTMYAALKDLLVRHGLSVSGDA